MITKLFNALIRRLKNPLLYFKLFQIAQYTKKRKVLKFSPYRQNHLETVISEFRSRNNTSIESFIDYHKLEHGIIKNTAKRNSIYFRIDVDYQDCVDNLPNLLNFLSAHGIKAGVYIRTDCLEYDPKDCEKVVMK